MYFFDFFNSFKQGQGAVVKWPGKPDCLKVSPAKFEKIANSFNKQGFDCKVFGDLDSKLINSNCKIYNNPQDKQYSLPAKFRAKRVYFLQNANWITIHTGLFANLDTEEKFVSVLAHELAHYYRAHSATYEDYDFYYELLKKNRGRKPEANRRLLKSGEKVFKAAQLKRNMKPWEEANSLENSIRAELFISAGSYITKACSYRTCEASCEDIESLWKNRKAYKKH